MVGFPVGRILDAEADDGDDFTIYNAIVDRAQEIAQEWRKDLARRTAGEVAEVLKKMAPKRRGGSK